MFADRQLKYQFGTCMQLTTGLSPLYLYRKSIVVTGIIACSLPLETLLTSLAYGNHFPSISLNKYLPSQTSFRAKVN
jgi:hypothetical protein